MVVVRVRGVALQFLVLYSVCGVLALRCISEHALKRCLALLPQRLTGTCVLRCR